MTTEDRYGNPFDRYSSRTRRLNYHLPFWQHGQKSHKHGMNGAFIGREDILYRLRNWILSKSQTGSFLVAGYRGMGKTSFVEKALYNITRQRRRSSRIEFLFMLMHLLAMFVTYLLCFKSLNFERIDWTTGSFIAGLALILLLSVGILLYIKKYHIRYVCNYLSFGMGLVLYIVRSEVKKVEHSLDIPRLLKKCASECLSRLRRLNREDRSRLNKTLFNDFRKKSFRRIAIHINLGHEILTERDILCLIAKRIQNEVENFVSNKHTYLIPAYSYILVCCLLAGILTCGLVNGMFKIVNDVYLDAGQTLRQTHSFLAFFNDVFHAICGEYRTFSSLLVFLSVYAGVYRSLMYTFRFIPGVKQFVNVRRRLRILNARIDTVIDEESAPVAETNSGFVNISLGRRTKRNYPMASVREIECELIDILEHFNRVVSSYTLNFIIIFDELDKIDPESVSKIQGEDLEDSTYENSSNGFSGDLGSRRRKENVLRLLANMKHFISTARAKFIFISGRELYDAYLAGLSDREFAISSVFGGAIYVESFLTSNRAQMNVTSMTEQYICKMLLPEKYLRDKMTERYYRYGVTTLEAPSLRWYYKYLYELSGKKGKGRVDEWEINGSIIFLHYFSTYLTHISNGSPQKIQSYFRMYIRTADNLYRKGNSNPRIFGISSPVKKPDRTYVLTFSYVNQRKIAFIFYMAYPIMQAIINNATLHGDKILISASFLMNHIYKYHSYSFSWRNLEQAPELLEVYRTPELRSFIHSILSFMVHTHMSNISSGLYNFKFRKSIANEIAIFSKHSEEVSAIFNFTLDESLSVKRHYARLMNHYTGLLNRSNSRNSHYSILLSRIHQVLGDLQMTDENYLESALEYRNSIVYLKELLHEDGSPEFDASGDVMLPLIRNMLKLGLTYERRRTNNSAYVIYYELVSMLIDFRYVDEAKLGMDLKVEKATDWRDKKYVLFKKKESEETKGKDLVYYLTRQDEIDKNETFRKEITSQLFQKGPKKACDSDQNVFEIQGEELIGDLSKILTPEKTKLIFRLSLLEDLRLVYQAVLAKLFVLEKVELGGITKANLDVSEAEFRYLYRVTNMKEKFIILADYFRRLAEILYYKNGLIDKNSDAFVTGLYFWGYEFDTDIEEYCREEGLNTTAQRSIKDELKKIKWNELDFKAEEHRGKDYVKVWEVIKESLDKGTPPPESNTSGNADSEDKGTLKTFLGKWEIEESYVKNLSYCKVDECNRHRAEMLKEGRSLPCFACRYYTRSMHILLEQLFGVKDIEDKVSKAREFLKRIDKVENSGGEGNIRDENGSHLLRSNYLQTVAIVLDGMGNVQVSCADRRSVLSEGFLLELSRLSDDNHTFERMESLGCLEKAVLYYWAASRFYKKGALLKDASICMKKILQLLRQYLTVREFFTCTGQVEMVAGYLCPIIKNVSRKAILYLYAHNENISISEIQDLKGVFSLKPYEDISLEKLSLYPDIEEVILLSMELKMICYRIYGYDTALMPEDFQKPKALNIIRLYSFRMASIFNVEKTVCQQLAESRVKAVWNFSFMGYLLDGVGLTETDAESGASKYRVDAPITFYRKLRAYLERSLDNDRLGTFGMDLKECGIQSDTMTVNNKLKLLEFLLKDSMFCLQRVLSLLTNNPSQSLQSNSYIADTYQMMFEWTQVFKFLYSLYEYMESGEDVRDKIVNSLVFFITSRHISMEDEDPLQDKPRNLEELRQVVGDCATIIEAACGRSDTETRSTVFYNQVLAAIDRTNLRYIISNYSAEMALEYYRKAKETHTEGNAYKEMISNMYYLDDDLQNDTSQYHIALERYMLNCGYIDRRAKSLKDVYSKANIYNVEWYERGDLSTPLGQRDMSVLD